MEKGWKLYYLENPNDSEFKPLYWLIKVSWIGVKPKLQSKIKPETEAENCSKDMKTFERKGGKGKLL